MESSPLDWAVVLYLPYANNLSFCAAPILRELSRGLGASEPGGPPGGPGRIGLLAQVKCRGDGCMTRHVGESARDGQPLLGNYLRSSPTEDADSASAETLERCLFEAERLFAGARNWFIAILGHGGGPSEVCPDDDAALIARAREEPPCDVDGLRWMGIAGLSAAVAGLHRRTSGGVRLLYMQNCARSLHALLSSAAGAAPAADFLLLSPLVLGAPNAYYAGVLRALRAAPNVDGRALARLIVEHEDPSQFGVLAAFDARAAPRFVAALEDFFALCAARIALSDSAALAHGVARMTLALAPACVHYYAGGVTDVYACVAALCRELLRLGKSEACDSSSGGGGGSSALDSREGAASGGGGAAAAASEPPLAPSLPEGPRIGSLASCGASSLTPSVPPSAAPPSALAEAHAAVEAAFRALLVFCATPASGRGGGDGGGEALSGLTLAFPLIVGKVGPQAFAPWGAHAPALEALEAAAHLTSLAALRRGLRAALEAHSDALRAAHAERTVQAASERRVWPNSRLGRLSAAAAPA